MPEVAMSRTRFLQPNRSASAPGRPYNLSSPYGALIFLLLCRRNFRQPALDDCVALRHVMSFIVARLDVGLVDLLRRFAVSLDEPVSIAQVHALLGD